MVRKVRGTPNGLQMPRVLWSLLQANLIVANLRRNLFRGGIPEETFAVSLVP
jgi:hypothetical protein